MKKYFLVKIKLEKVAEEGKSVKVSEQYLIDALSFTEAEERIIEEMTPFISGEFEVSNITPQKIHEIFTDGEFAGDKWFKAKVNFISLDEQKGIEKKIATTMLVQADTLNNAENNLQFGMKGSMADYEIASITETKILDVFNYKSEE